MMLKNREIEVIEICCFDTLYFPGFFQVWIWYATKDREKLSVSLP